MIITMGMMIIVAMKITVKIIKKTAITTTMSLTMKKKNQQILNKLKNRKAMIKNNKLLLIVLKL
jgi:hypothetical protein